MKYNRWTGGTYDMSAVARLREAGYPSLLATVLAARGITDEEAEALLQSICKELGKIDVTDSHQVYKETEIF